MKIRNKLGLTGLALIAALGCGGSVSGNRDNTQNQDSADTYQEDNLEDSGEFSIDSKDIKLDSKDSDKPYIPDQTDNPFIPEDYDSFDAYEGLDNSSDSDVIDKDNLDSNDFNSDSDNELEDIVDSNNLKSKIDSFDSVDANDDASKDNVDSGYDNGSNDVVDCAPVAKACGDDYRWKAGDPGLPGAEYIGKCRPLEITVDFDGYFDVCFDFSGATPETSGCKKAWSMGYYKIPGHPTGSYAKCERKIVTWVYGFDKESCDAGGQIYSTSSFMTHTFWAGFSDVLCIGVEDDMGTLNYENINLSVEKKE